MPDPIKAGVTSLEKNFHDPKFCISTRFSTFIPFFFDTSTVLSIQSSPLYCIIRSNTLFMNCVVLISHSMLPRDWKEVNVCSTQSSQKITKTASGLVR